VESPLQHICLPGASRCSVTGSSLVTGGLKRSVERLNLAFSPHVQGFGLASRDGCPGCSALGLTEEVCVHSGFPACPERDSAEEPVERSTRNNISQGCFFFLSKLQNIEMVEKRIKSITQSIRRQNSHRNFFGDPALKFGK